VFWARHGYAYTLNLIGLGFAAFYEQTAYGTGPMGYSGWGIELVPGLEPACARLTGDGPGV